MNRSETVFVSSSIIQKAHSRMEGSFHDFEEQAFARWKECRIVLLGKTGYGKSSTGNTILGTGKFLAENTILEKKKDLPVQLPNCQVTIVDTPGLFDTQTGYNPIKEITRSLNWSLPGPHAILFVIRINSRFTEKQQELFIEDIAPSIVFDYTHQDQLGRTQDNDEKMYLRGLKPRITRQPETISQDERRRLHAVLCREATSNLPHSMQFSLHIGDKRIGDGSYRKAAGIDDGRSTLLAKTILYMSNMSTPYGLEDDIKLSVKLNLKGENKDYWTHSLTANGEVALPEKQRMYLSQPLRQLQSSGKCFPVSVHWVLETTEGSPQDLEAEVQLFDVTDNNSHNQVVVSLSTENVA